VVSLKEKVLLFLAATVLITLAFTPLARAYASMSIYGYTDKPYYKAGETGTLKFWIYNDGTDDLILKNATIYYPWYNILWGGNETIKPSSDTVIQPNGNWSYSLTFNVPSDGRAHGGSIEINVVTDKASDSQHVTLNIASVPAYTLFEDTDKLVTLFTILVVLVIVCTVIIAATIFLSARRPQIMWKTEEKTQ
jgi:uncharacterized membrane protein